MTLLKSVSVKISLTAAAGSALVDLAVRRARRLTARQFATLVCRMPSRSREALSVAALAGICVQCVPGSAVAMPVEENNLLKAVYPMSQSQWWPRADFAGGPCILESDLERAFSKGLRLPRTCIEQPCREVLTLKRMDREIYGRSPRPDEVARYNSAWVHTCLGTAHADDWDTIHFYQLAAEGFGDIAQMVALTRQDEAQGWPLLAYNMTQGSSWSPAYPSRPGFGAIPFSRRGGAGQWQGSEPPHVSPAPEIIPTPLPPSALFLGGTLVLGLARCRKRASRQLIARGS